MIYLILFLFYFIEIECGLVFIATSVQLFSDYTPIPRKDSKDAEQRAFLNTIFSIADVPNRQTLHFAARSNGPSSDLQDRLGYKHSRPKLTLQHAINDDHISAINNTG